MKRWASWSLVACLGAASIVALVTPWQVAAVLALGAFACLRRGHAMFLLFAATTLVLGALVLALWLPGSDLLAWGLVRLGSEGAMAGFAGAVRLVALLGMNLALLSWVSAVRILDGLRLHPWPTAVLAAILIAAHDVGGDLGRIAAAVRLQGPAPRGLRRKVRRAAAWVPALLVSSLRRADVRRDALHLAGLRVPAGFVPVVAISALAVASRLALAPIPHLKATYLIVFLGGLLFGARVGMVAAAVGMALSNLLLTGLLPNSFVNVPAMAALGALGGALRRSDFTGTNRMDKVSGPLLAGAIGVFATLLFSVLADATDWLVLSDLRAKGIPVLQGRIATGLAFNAIPAAFNGLLFALAVGPTQQTMRQLSRGAASSIPPPGAGSAATST